jgi:hypothetical protein
MFYHSYSEGGGFVDATGPTPLQLIADLELYLTDFLNRIFSRENAKNRAFYGGKKSTAVSIYHAGINQGTAPWKPARCLRCLHLSYRTRPILSPFVVTSSQILTPLRQKTKVLASKATGGVALVKA